MSSGDVLGPGNIGSRESSVMCHFPRSELASDWPEWNNPALSLADGRWWLRWSDDRREPGVQLYNDKKSSLTRWPCHLSPLVSIFLVCKTDDITHPCYSNLCWSWRHQCTSVHCTGPIIVHLVHTVPQWGVKQCALSRSVLPHSQLLVIKQTSPTRPLSIRHQDSDCPVRLWALGQLSCVLTPSDTSGALRQALGHLANTAAIQSFWDWRKYTVCYSIMQ